MNLGNCSLWSWIFIPSSAMCQISSESIGLPSITWTSGFSFYSWSDIWWYHTQSWFRITMPGAKQYSRACVGISWLFAVNVQVITKCFPFLDLSNTSTLLTDKREIPKHVKQFGTTLLLSTEEPSLFPWLALFPIPWNLSRLLLPLPPLQPHWPPKPSFLPHTPQLCGRTHHNTNISHL